MKKFLTILLILCSLVVHGQLTLTPGVNNIYTVGSYSYMTAYPANMPAGAKCHVIVQHEGLGETTAAGSDDSYGYAYWVRLGWDMRMVKAPGDTIYFAIVVIPHQGFTMSRVAPGIDAALNHYQQMGIIDSSDHSKFVSVSISKGGQVMWYYLRNYQDHNSPYRIQLAKRTMTISTMSLSSSAYEVNLTTMNYPGRHVVYYGTADSNPNTTPAMSIFHYNNIHSNSTKRLDSLIGGDHNPTTWNTAMSISAYGTPGTTNSNNLLAWVLDVDAMSSNQAPIADAGPDQETNNTTVTLDGGSSTDADGTITGYSWAKISGTGGTITNPLNSATTVSGLSPGTYVFRLTVTDNEGAQNSDDVTITITQAAGSTGGYIRYGRKAVFN